MASEKHIRSTCLTWYLVEWRMPCSLSFCITTLGGKVLLNTLVLTGGPVSDRLYSGCYRANDFVVLRYYYKCLSAGSQRKPAVVVPQ